MEKKVFLKQPENIAALTTLTLMGLGGIQIFLGENVSQSVALTANGIDCIGDAFVSGVVWIGLRYLKKPEDHRFHFGYYKIENLASIIAAVIMLILAGYIFYQSYQQLMNPRPIMLPFLGASIAFIAAFIAWGFGISKYINGKKTKYSSIKLDAINTLKDGTTSFLAGIALIFGSFGITLADAVIGFIIAGIIVTIGFAAIKESSSMLVDACDGDCVAYGLLIKNLAERIPGVQAARLIRLRRTGPVIQGELEISVSGDMPVKELYIIKQKIVQLAQQKIPELQRLTISSLPDHHNRNHETIPEESNKKRDIDT
ncbi:MAG: cation diffusion facilitator family transporter [Candidatus Thermoplasmatota archaeon]